MKLRADTILKEMAKTFKKNNTKYKDNWDMVGKIFTAMYPQGIQLRSEYDFVLFHFLSWKIGKLTRFILTDHGHIDSIHDDAVYTAMIETLVRGKQSNRKKTKYVNKKRS